MEGVFEVDVDSVREGLITWLRRRVEEAAAEGIIVGLSGGVDSAVVAGLGKRAFPEHTFGVIMPCHSDPIDAEYATRVAERFDLPAYRVDLVESWDLLVNRIEGEVGIDGPDERLRNARMNVKPRLRMTTLYYVAARHNCLVAGTGNLPELTVGYFTKHGDGGVDLLPLANLVKGEVYELARDLDVPAEIIERPPSAGLRDGQTDEKEMGIAYDALDRYLRTGEATPEVRQRIEHLRALSEHKRALPAQGPNPHLV